MLRRRSGSKYWDALKSPYNVGALFIHRKSGGKTAALHNYQWARMRYFRIEVPSFATGTLNCAAHAAVFVNL